MLVNERNRASGTNAGVSVKGKGSELVKYNLATAITITILLVLVTVSSASSETPRKIGPGYDIEMSRMIPLTGRRSPRGSDVQAFRAPIEGTDCPLPHAI